MPLRQDFTEALKSAMRGGDAARTSTIRMILAKVKDADIAARPGGITAIPDEDITALLRGMVKQRREAAEMYAHGKRQDLVDKENAEITVIEGFLPRQMDDAALEAAVNAAVAETGAASIRDMGRVMAALKSRHAATLDMARAGAAVKARLAAG